MKRLLVAVLLLTGCASHFPEANTRTPSPGTQPQARAPQAGATPQAIGYSVQGRPIEMWSFGAVEGGRPVIVMGAIHGNETGSAEVSRGLLGELMKAPRAVSDGVRGVPVAIIPVANPDGLAAGTRQNANKSAVTRTLPPRTSPARAAGR